MKATYQVPWISNNTFQAEGKNPFVAVITSVEQREKNEKLENVITFEGTSTEACMSIWGLNAKILIKNFGEEMEEWKGKRILIGQTTDNGKTKRFISVSV